MNENLSTILSLIGELESIEEQETKKCVVKQYSAWDEFWEGFGQWFIDNWKTIVIALIVILAVIVIVAFAPYLLAAFPILATPFGVISSVAAHSITGLVLKSFAIYGLVMTVSTFTSNVEEEGWAYAFGYAAPEAIIEVLSFGMASKLRTTDGVLDLSDDVDDLVHVVDDVSFSSHLDNLKTLETTYDNETGEILTSYSDGTVRYENGSIKSGPYVNGNGKPNRPSYAKGQVETVYNRNVEKYNGSPQDVNTGEAAPWDRTRSRSGQWDMGHIKGESFHPTWQKYQRGDISKKEFLKWYQNPNNYQVELPKNNRSHKFE